MAPAAAAPRSRSERGAAIPPPYRHLVFDLDGTLVDSSDDLVAATDGTLAGLGLRPIGRERVLAYVGQGLERLLARSLEAAAPGRSGALLGPARALFAELYGAGLLHHTRPFAGMEEVLRGLSERGVALSVLTNKPRAFTEPILRGLGLAGLFLGSVCGDDDVPRKPAPDGARRLVAASRVPPAATALVGDSAEDVATARAAGLGSCAVAWGFRTMEELLAAAPDHLVREPAELVPLCAGGRTAG